MCHVFVHSISISLLFVCAIINCDLSEEEEEEEVQVIKKSRRGSRAPKIGQRSRKKGRGRRSSKSEEDAGEDEADCGMRASRDEEARTLRALQVCFIITPTLTSNREKTSAINSDIDDVDSRSLLADRL